VRFIREGEAHPGLKATLMIHFPRIPRRMLGRTVAHQPAQLVLAKTVLLQAMNLDREIPRGPLTIQRVIPGLEKEEKGGMNARTDSWAATGSTAFNANPSLPRCESSSRKLHEGQ